MRRLAEAGAFAGSKESGTALWEALDLGRTPAPSLPLASREHRPDFEPLGEFETIEWDYRFSAHSTLGHPLAPLRDALTSGGCQMPAPLPPCPTGAACATPAS